MAKENKRKKRVPAVRIDFGKDQIIGGIDVSGEGRLTFFDEKGQPVNPRFTEVDSTYARHKGRKTLNRIVADPTRIELNPNRSLLRYKHVFAVDTNTDVVNGVKTSITVGVYVTNIKVNKPGWDATLVRQCAFEFQGANEPPEKIGWCEFAAFLAKNGLDESVAMIVDAHLTELKAINDRTRSICRGYFLPKGIELLYASSDVGRVEFISNAALAHCDKAGRALMNLSARSAPETFRSASHGSPYNRSRVWTPPKGSSEDWGLIQNI